MYTVEVQKECGCFKRSEFQKTKSFEKRQDAILYTESLVDLMNEDFCQKHHFMPMTVSEDKVLIIMGTPASGGGCCGGGHCG
jgi:hypothetical protein